MDKKCKFEKRESGLKPTKTEADFIVGLLKSYEAELKSSKAIGMEVPESEEKIVSSLNDKFQMYI